MKTRTVVTLAVCSCMCAMAWQVPLASQALAGEISAVVAVTAAIPMAGDGGAAYVGSKKCKKCHLGQSKTWKKTKMNKALDLLLPGNSEEAKKKHGLDVAKDYSKDESCLACHTTGFGHPGGYAIPDPTDEKAAKKAKKLAGVGCESCHGPGGEYIKLHEEVMKSKRTYKVEEMYAAGMRKIDESACTSCHNEKSATYDPANPFDFEKMRDTDGHEHSALKQREE